MVNSIKCILKKPYKVDSESMFNINRVRATKKRRRMSFPTCNRTGIYSLHLNNYWVDYKLAFQVFLPQLHDKTDIAWFIVTTFFHISRFKKLAIYPRHFPIVWKYSRRNRACSYVEYGAAILLESLKILAGILSGSHDFDALNFLIAF